MWRCRWLLAWPAVDRPQLSDESTAVAFRVAKVPTQYFQYVLYHIFTFLGDRLENFNENIYFFILIYILNIE